MATIVIDSSTPQARQFLKFARTLPFAEVKREKKAEPEYDIYASLESAFAEVKLMKEGKKKGKSLDELIEELRTEREYELHNGSH